MSASMISDVSKQVIHLNSGSVVCVPGHWNRFDAKGNRMALYTNDSGDLEFVASNIPLSVGAYDYKFVVDDVWCTDATRHKTHENNHVIVIERWMLDSQNDVARLEDEVHALKRAMDDRRRAHQDELHAARGGINVLVRVRSGTNPRGSGSSSVGGTTDEFDGGPAVTCAPCVGNSLCIRPPPDRGTKERISKRDMTRVRREFGSVCGPQAGQEVIFHELSDSILSVLDGFNVAVLGSMLSPAHVRWQPLPNPCAHD